MAGHKQRFRNIWIWTLIILLNIFLVYCLISQIVFDKPVGNHPVSNLALFIICLIPFALLILLLIMYLRVDVTKDEILIEYFPFLKKRILMSEISDIKQVTYRPVQDYGGWGIRYSTKGTAYTIHGNQGLELKLISGKNILIGINKHSDLKHLKKSAKKQN